MRAETLYIYIYSRVLAAHNRRLSSQQHGVHVDSVCLFASRTPDGRKTRHKREIDMGLMWPGTTATQGVSLNQKSRR